GAALGHRERRTRRALLARVVLGAHDLRDHFARALDDHAVPHAHVETAHLVEVVQRRALYRGAAYKNGRKPRDRREDAGPPDIHLDVLDGGRHLLGRELERGRPLRVVRDEAEPLLIHNAIDLHDDAVGPVVEVVPLLPPAVDESERLLDVLRTLPVGVRTHTELSKPLEALVLRRYVEAGR